MRFGIVESETDFLRADREVLVRDGRQREAERVAFDLGALEVVHLLVKERDQKRVPGDQVPSWR